MRLALAAALAALVGLTAPAFAQTVTARQPTISVMGTGEVELKPDVAQLFVSVETEAPTVAQASAANRTATERVLARIQSLGVKKEDIETVNFQVLKIEPPMEKLGLSSRDKNDKSALKFEATHQLRIKTRDLDGAGQLAGEILASGDMTFQSVSFGLDRQEEGGDKAREAAVRDAKRQAEVYAAAAGVALGRLIEIRDGSAQPIDSSEMVRMQMAPAKSDGAIPLVPPATIRYNANVQLVWEIAPKP